MKLIKQSNKMTTKERNLEVERMQNELMMWNIQRVARIGVTEQVRLWREFLITATQKQIIKAYKQHTAEIGYVDEGH